MQLRPYQEKSVNELRKSFASGKKSPLFVLPTGGGKTFVFCYIAKNAIAKNNNVLIVVHRQELIRQASKSLQAIGLSHGVIAPKYNYNGNQKIQIASVQTLVRRMNKMPWQPNLIIYDECHHCSSPTWKQVYEFYSNAVSLGVTATPCRLDGAGLGSVFDDMIIGASISELTKLGNLVPADVYAPPIDLDLSDVKTVAGDYNKKQIIEKIDKPSITGDVINHYKNICNNKSAICFCVSVAHAEYIAESFRNNGINAMSIDGTLDSVEREKRINALATGEISVLTSCDIISEGTDIPSVTAAILLRPTKSLSLYLQQVGRVLRPADGKEKAIILDHVGNTKRHGFYDEEREWTLDAKIKNKRAKNEELEPYTCLACFRQMRKPTPENCPYCGTEIKRKTKAEIEVVGGELQKITEQQKFEYGIRKKQMIAQARTYEELSILGKQLGYKPGWAWHMTKSRKQKYERA